MRKKIYELLRKYVARRATYNLGKVEITDDEIICHVDEKKIKRKEKYLHRYNLMFHFIPKNEEMYNIYKVDKPVHYIVRNVDFDMEVKIITAIKDCHVTFENCNFTAGIEIDFADHLTFKNNTYRVYPHKNYYSIYGEGEFCISTTTNKNEVNKLEFINDEIIIPDNYSISISKGPKFKHKITPVIQLWLYAKNIILDNTDVIDAESIEIGANTLILNSTSISSKEIEIDSETILADNTTTIDTEIISIENNNETKIKKINSKSIFINGVEINKNKTQLDSDDLELQKKRLELINTFNKMESSCEETIAEEIKKQPLTRVLRK